MSNMKYIYYRLKKMEKVNQDMDDHLSDLRNKLKKHQDMGHSCRSVNYRILN